MAFLVVLGNVGCFRMPVIILCHPSVIVLTIVLLIHMHHRNGCVGVVHISIIVWTPWLKLFGSSIFQSKRQLGLNIHTIDASSKDLSLCLSMPDLDLVLKVT